MCTARVPKIPTPASGTSIVDLGTIGLEGARCETDGLAERMAFRGRLIEAWKARAAKKP
jgi:hypothetical protein